MPTSTPCPYLSVLWPSYDDNATRIHQTRPWVVSVSILSGFDHTVASMRVPRERAIRVVAIA